MRFMASAENCSLPYLFSKNIFLFSKITINVNVLKELEPLHVRSLAGDHVLPQLHDHQPGSGGCVRGWCRRPHHHAERQQPAEPEGFALAAAGGV